jgi:hypothetical protein
VGILEGTADVADDADIAADSGNSVEFEATDAAEREDTNIDEVAATTGLALTLISKASASFRFRSKYAQASLQLKTFSSRPCEYFDAPHWNSLVQFPQLQLSLTSWVHGLSSVQYGVPWHL